VQNDKHSLFQHFVIYQELNLQSLKKDRRTSGIFWMKYFFFDFRKLEKNPESVNIIKELLFLNSGNFIKIVVH